MAVKWAIDTGGTLEAGYRKEWGDEGYAKRKQIAKEKADQFPANEWERQMFMAVQFESIAMQASEATMFGTSERIGLVDRDYRFWDRLISKLVIGK